MFIDDCEDCKIITGPIIGSIMMRTSKNCTFCTVTKQLRFRDCENIKCFTLCTSDPAVESSFNIYFAPYNVFFPHLKECFTKAKYNQNEDKNHISTPYDFTTDKVLGGGAPHYLMLPDEQFEIEEVADGDSPAEELYNGYSQEEPLVKDKVGDKYANSSNRFDQGDFDFNNNNSDNNFPSFQDNSGMPNQSQNNVDNFFMMGNNDMNNQNQNIPLGNNDFNMAGFDMGNQNISSNQNNMGRFDYSSNIPLGAPIEQLDEEEIQRQELRKKEAEERARKIREKMEYELKMKNELREEAVQFMNKFNEERQARINRNKLNNQQNEQNAKKEKNDLMALSGDKINHWEGVASNISLKESDYKGSNDVTRMRQCIISRKNDFKK